MVEYMFQILMSSWENLPLILRYICVIQAILQQGSSVLECISRWRLSTIKVQSGLNWILSLHTKKHIFNAICSSSIALKYIQNKKLPKVFCSKLDCFIQKVCCCLHCNCHNVCFVVKTATTGTQQVFNKIKTDLFAKNEV